MVIIHYEAIFIIPRNMSMIIFLLHRGPVSREVYVNMGKCGELQVAFVWVGFLFTKLFVRDVMDEMF